MSDLENLKDGDKFSLTEEQVAKIKKDRIQMYKKDMDLLKAWKEYATTLASISKAEYEELVYRQQTTQLKAELMKKQMEEQEQAKKSVEQSDKTE